mmetsp:Transcript_39048/g.91179  ORF Transcript_39048/g.91179 Transcript_39048/m.91179 type:complete len:208 (+) Transcript_39048:1777-2400(+)
MVGRVLISAELSSTSSIMFHTLSTASDTDSVLNPTLKALMMVGRQSFATSCDASSLVRESSRTRRSSWSKSSISSAALSACERLSAIPECSITWWWYDIVAGCPSDAAAYCTSMLPAASCTLLSRDRSWTPRVRTMAQSASKLRYSSLAVSLTNGIEQAPRSIQSGSTKTSRPSSTRAATCSTISRRTGRSATKKPPSYVWHILVRV